MPAPRISVNYREVSRRILQSGARADNADYLVLMPKQWWIVFPVAVDLAGLGFSCHHLSVPQCLRSSSRSSRLNEPGSYLVGCLRGTQSLAVSGCSGNAFLCPHHGHYILVWLPQGKSPIYHQRSQESQLKWWRCSTLAFIFLLGGSNPKRTGEAR